MIDRGNFSFLYSSVVIADSALDSEGEHQFSSDEMEEFEESVKTNSVENTQGKTKFALFEKDDSGEESSGGSDEPESEEENDDFGSGSDEDEDDGDDKDIEKLSKKIEKKEKKEM